MANCKNSLEAPRCVTILLMAASPARSASPTSVARLAPVWIAILVIAGYGLAAPAEAVPHTRVIEAVASWLPLGDGALRARLAMGVVAAVAAWAITRAMAIGGGGGGAIAGGFAACLLISSPAWLGAGLGPALATGAALLALAASRRLAAGGAAHDAAHDAVAAALAVLVATMFEPGYAGLAAPVAALWWLRVGRRATFGWGPRSARSAPASSSGRLHLAGVLTSPALALLAVAIAALRSPSGAALLWPGWKLGGAPLAFATFGGALRAQAEMLGPTAMVAALAGALALLLPMRRLVGGAASSGEPANAAPPPAIDAPAGPWILAMLGAMAASGAIFDVARGAIGVPSVTAVALAAGFAIQRLAAMAVITIGPADDAALLGAFPSAPALGGESGAALLPSGSGAHVAAALAMPATTITIGAIFVALTAGFLVLAPSLLF